MDAKAIGKKLVHLRAGKSREEVCSALGLSVSTLQMYENGKRIPQDDIKIRIAKYYETTVGGLFFSEKVHETCTREVS